MCKYREERKVDDMFGFDSRQSELPLYVKWTGYCMHWYIRKAVQYRFSFYFFSIIAIVCPLVSTVLLNSNVNEALGITVNYWIIAGLSIVTSLASSMLALFNMKEKWNIYRSAAEYLKMEYIEFISDEKVRSQEEIEQYVKRINTHMQQIHVKWQEISFKASLKNEKEIKKI